MRQKIDDLFKGLAGKIYDRPWLFIIMALVMFGVIATQLSKLRIDTSNESFFHKNDPILLAYEDFQDQFGWDEIIVIALEPPEIFDQSFLKKLTKLHNELVTKVPNLADITSMVNARNTRGEADQLIVKDLLEQLPQNDVEMASLKERVMSNPLYINRLISSDGRMTSIVLETDLTAADSGASMDDLMNGFDETVSAESIASLAGPTKNDIAEEVVSVVQDVVKKYRTDDFPIYVAGTPVVLKDHKAAMKKDQGRFLLVAFILIGFFLFLMFRRISGLILPLLIVILTLFSTLGLMGFCQIAFTLPNMIMPSFLLAVGVGASVHILSLTYGRFEKTGNRRDAITYALDHSGLAVVMTSLTTAAGMISFASADMAPVAYLGIFSSAGVLISLFYTLILLPALLAVIPLKQIVRKTTNKRTVTSRFDQLLDWIADVSTGHPKLITVLTIVILVLGVLSALKLHFSHDTLKWLPASWASRQATEKIDEVMGGTINLEVLVDTGHENGLYDPVVLKHLNNLADELEDYDDGRIRIAKATSISDILKEIHQALNENRPDFYTIPDNAKLIPQEFLLFENSGSDDLEKVTDSSFRLARFTIQVPWQDIFYYVPVIKEIEHKFQVSFGDSAEISTTGILRLFASTVTASAKSMAESYVSAGIVITLMMIFLLGSLRLGLISMIPNLAPVVMVMGLMYWLGLPLDTFTMMIGTIALGLAVDDTVHFMNGFRRFYKEGGSVRTAVRRSLDTSGRAMLVTSAVLSIGFFVYMFAFMRNMVHFGFLTGLTIILALVADFIAAPAMMALIYSDAKDKQNK